MDEEVVFNNYLPPKNKLVLALLSLQFPILFPGVKWFIRRQLRHSSNDIDFFPGLFFFYGYNIYAGKKVHLGDSLIMDYAPVYIGDNSYLSWKCTIATAHHHQDRRKPIIYAKPVRIGKNVQIYSGCIIVGGVTIGNNSVIAAGSVVTKSIPANCFAAGNPARVIRKL